MKRLLFPLAALAFFFCAAQPASAQVIRLSVKHVLDSNGNRSNGWYTSDNAIYNAVSQANEVLWNNGFTWFLTVGPIIDVPGISQHFDLGSGGHEDLEDDALANPSLYHWRSDAINFYIVNSLSGAGGICSFPMTGEINVINNQGILGDGIGWLHEIGHYLSLTHTFEDCIPDNPNTCTGAGATHTGSCTDIVDCNDTCPDTTNVMSYHSFPVSSATLSACQKGHMEYEFLDPNGSRAHVVCNSYTTTLVGQSIAATLPYICDGGVLDIDAGVYAEGPITISEPRTITTNGGLVALGVPGSADSCANATRIVGFGTFGFDNSAATMDGPPACDVVGQTDIDKDVWFEWVPNLPHDGSVTFSTCGGTGVDTKLAVYRGDTCPPTQLLDCDDDSCGLQTEVTLPDNLDFPFLVRVGTYPGAAGGVGTFTVTPGP